MQAASDAQLRAAAAREAVLTASAASAAAAAADRDTARADDIALLQAELAELRAELAAARAELAAARDAVGGESASPVARTALQRAPGAAQAGGEEVAPLQAELADVRAELAAAHKLLRSATQAPAARELLPLVEQPQHVVAAVQESASTAVTAEPRTACTACTAHLAAEEGGTGKLSLGSTAGVAKRGAGGTENDAPRDVAVAAAAARAPMSEASHNARLQAPHQHIQLRMLR
eukprot:362855-Chlamydomonas_euryale.AAC.3